MLDQRCAGVLLPLFSIRSARNWGVGDFADVQAFAAWAAQAGMRNWMMLPLLEPGGGQNSPYGPLSAFAMDPAYAAMDQLEDFVALGGENALSDSDKELLAGVRDSKSVQYDAIRKLKRKYFRRSHQHFRTNVDARSARTRSFKRFREENASWLPDYALFRAIKMHTSRSWRKWPRLLRDRDPKAVRAARVIYAPDMAYFEYVQWVLYSQFAEARRQARALNTKLTGDMPFLVGEDSADVWANQADFRFDATVGAPPDAFNEEGQNWGLPVYQWDRIRENGYAWFRERGRVAAMCFDMVRVDHVVGLYRTFIWPHDKTIAAHFVPSEEPLQTTQGEEVLMAMRAGGADIVAEDLGVIPPFVHRSLAELRIPGYRVFRWETDGAQYKDPTKWPEISLSTTGTHDTDTVADWWDATTHERHELMKLPAFAAHHVSPEQHFDARVRDAVLDTVYGASSLLTMVPYQDLFGTRDRINVPGTVGEHNWTYRTPETVEQLLNDVALIARTTQLRELAKTHGR